ncbi:MAG: glycosyl hydrolase family 43 [Lentisphaerae bacterium]|nr:MAG: glycosyl hydrolase family 43 [Lentisphaerota bacterium]
MNTSPLLAYTGNPIRKRLGKADRNAGFRMEGYRIWGSSVIRGDDGRYHMFVTRVPACMRFHPGWMIASEIVHAVSETPEGPYRFADIALAARGAQYWDGRSAHNPKVVHYAGRYYLFYMGSTHPFEDVTPENADLLDLQSKWCIAGRANKRVGVAVSESPWGPWQRFDEPLLPTRPNTFYSFLTSNPAPVIEASGRTFLIFKARAYEGNTHGAMSIGLAVAPHPLGPYEVINHEPLFSPANIGEVEDPYLWKDEDGFHILAKDQQGTISGLEPGCGILAHSPDCLHWELDPDPVAYRRQIVWKDGTQTQPGNMERVSGLHDEHGVLTHLFFAVWEGTRGFCDESPHAQVWNMVIPLLDGAAE